MTARKYRPGRRITSLNTLMRRLDKDGFIYLRHKIQHKGWVLSLQFRTILSNISGGWVRTAEKINTEENENGKQ